MIYFDNIFGFDNLYVEGVDDLFIKYLNYNNKNPYK